MEGKKYKQKERSSKSADGKGKTQKGAKTELNKEKTQKGRNVQSKPDKDKNENSEKTKKVLVEIAKATKDKLEDHKPGQPDTRPQTAHPGVQRVTEQHQTTTCFMEFPKIVF